MTKLAQLKKDSASLEKILHQFGELQFEWREFAVQAMQLSRDLFGQPIHQLTEQGGVSIRLRQH